MATVPDGAAAAAAAGTAKSSIIFLGSGSSTGLPKPSALFRLDDDTHTSRVSKLALEGAPEENRNYR